jgi:hypothetical protein
MSFEPKCLATGIGSLPFTDAGSAMQMINKYFTDIPNWPQLPLRGREEHFVNLYLKPLLTMGLLTDDGNKIYFDTTQSDWADRLASFYTVYLAYEEGDLSALEEFAFSKEFAAGFHAFAEEMEKGTRNALMLKGQVVGPFTVAFQVKDERGRFAYYNDVLRDLIVKTITMHSAWQAAELARFGLPVMIFIDDPALGVYGQSNYITVTKEMIREDMDAVYQAVHRMGGLVGVHCCDAIDWSILFESDLDVVSFDAYNYFGSVIPFTESLAGFLERGGSLAWGIVPTLNDRALIESDDSLIAILDGYWSELMKRGIPRDVLFKSSLVTPACGTGLLGVNLADRIFALTSSVSKKLRLREGC